MTGGFHPEQPIYLQLVQKIQREIVRGERRPGERLPSVRDFALEHKVNPNTVQRVYLELERNAIVEKRRGQGTFVTHHPERLKALREEMKEELITRFVEAMKEMGFTHSEILDGLRHHLDNQPDHP